MIIKRIARQAKRLCQRFAYNFATKAIVLAYHRVIDLQTDPQLLAVSRDNFAEQLRELKKNYHVCSLQELFLAMQQGSIKKKTVVITFDDGYLDNAVYALPLLEEYKQQATFFVAADYTGKKEEFWWDALELLLLYPSQLPKKISVIIRSCLYEWSLLDVKSIQDDLLKSWNVLCNESPADNFIVYRELHRLLKQLTYEEIAEVLNQLRKQLDVTPCARDYYRVVAHDELRALSQSPFVTIGSHTSKHSKLSAQFAAYQRDEIFRSQQQLATITSQKINLFSYPYGGRTDFTQETVGLLHQAGYCGAVANYEGLVTKNTDPYAISRYLVRNWSGIDFARQLQTWFAR